MYGAQTRIYSNISKTKLPPLWQSPTAIGTIGDHQIWIWFLKAQACP